MSAPTTVTGSISASSTRRPANNLFAYNMFLRPTEDDLEHFQPDWQILSAPGLQLDPAQCGTRNPNAVVISFRHRLILLAGTGYTGEMKKGGIHHLNFLLPHEEKMLSMHCSANKGPKGDTAIFFGLSGTGKTTLSADPARRLIGDDEHGWTDDNIFNFEGGCYAKCINLKEEKEPDIYRAIRPGALVENVRFFPDTDQINFEDGSITENTRVSYPLSYIATSLEPSVGPIPANIFFLTCDAYGVLPPISTPHPRPGHVPVHFRLYGKGRRYRDGHYRTQTHIQRLLRRSLPAAASRPLCRIAGQKDQTTMVSRSG